MIPRFTLDSHLLLDIQRLSIVAVVIVPVQGLLVTAVLILADFQSFSALLVAFLFSLVFPLLFLLAPQLLKWYARVDGFELQFDFASLFLLASLHLLHLLLLFLF